METEFNKWKTLYNIFIILYNITMLLSNNKNYFLQFISDRRLNTYRKREITICTKPDLDQANEREQMRMNNLLQ